MPATLRRALMIGLYGGIAGIHVSLVGIVNTFQSRDLIADIVTIGSVLPMLIAIMVGWLAARRPRHVTARRRPLANFVLGAAGGAVTGLILAVLAIIVDTVTLTWILVNARPQLASILQFEQGPVVGSLLLVGGGAFLGAAGAGLHVLPGTIARAVAVGGIVTIIVALMEPFIGAVLRNVELRAIEGFLYESGGLTLAGFIVVYLLIAAGVYLWAVRGDRARERVAAMPPDRRRAGKIVVYLATIGVLLILPQIVGQRLSEVVGTVGIYVLLGLGLNIVVGFAGLLDLGYVAFYAVGAYTTALLTSPASPVFNPELPFWGALPFVIIAAAIIGLAVGAPVLRLRGDYLAIVTLGFGEIAREIFKSAWAQPVTGGAQGILSIPEPLPFSTRSAVDLLPDPLLLHPRRHRGDDAGVITGRPRLERHARGRIGRRGDRRQHDQVQAARLRPGRRVRLPVGCVLRREDRRGLPRQLQHPREHQRPGADHPRRHGQHRRRRARRIRAGRTPGAAPRVRRVPPPDLRRRARGHDASPTGGTPSEPRSARRAPRGLRRGR